MKPVVLVDFDGVLQAHGEPVPGGVVWIKDLQAGGFEPVIFTSRAEKPDQAYWVKTRLQEHGYSGPPLRITDRKLRCHAIVDDRAFPYTGHRFPTISQLRAFEPWWAR